MTDTEQACPACGAPTSGDGDWYVCSREFGCDADDVESCAYIAGLRSKLQNMEQSRLYALEQVAEQAERAEKAGAERDEALGGNHYYEMAKELRAMTQRAKKSEAAYRSLDMDVMRWEQNRASKFLSDARRVAANFLEARDE